MKQLNLDPSLKSAMEKTLELAKRSGADEAEVLYNGGEQLGLKAESGLISEHKVSHGQIFGVRLFKEHKVGTAYSEDIQESSLQTMIDKALTSLKYSEDKPHEKLQSKEHLSDVPEVVDETPLEKKFETALKLESAVKAKNDLVKGAPYNGINEGFSERASMNTLGGFCYERHPYAQCYTSALLENEGKQAMFHEASIARSFSKLRPEHCIDTSVEYAQKLLEGKPIKSGRYRVFFSIDQLASLFGVFSKMFSAKALVEGTHPLKEKIGKQVASPLLCLTDSPRAKEALYPELFDDEGLETQDNPLLVDGVLNSLYHNSATASELNLKNTHNASRSPKGVLSVGSTLKKIHPGETDESDFKRETVLEIFDMQGLHSGADPHSGHFSFGASGRLWRDSEIVQVVKGITVSGNFYQAIQEVEGLGDKLYTNTSKSFVAPLVCFKSLGVAGD